ncbi:MFS transporter [Nocardioides sp. 616]|uniref:MFS transporter n=1 Tax=Nocardioides sp. 616 TaxID=2268090 RepID=UPI000CE5258E|nr:MFS transporter [Nocardioides sp. 616]
MRGSQRTLVPALVYAALSTAVVSSLGMLLVPSIAVEMDVAVSTAQWMLTVNLLAGAVATPVMGRLSDGPRKKRLLLVSLAIVLLGCAVAATAPSFEVFLLGRALQGLTYGIVPVTIALVRQHSAPDRSQSAISSLSVTVATGIGVGYPLTGILAGTFDYRAAFWFATVFVVSAIVVVVKAIPDDVPTSAPAPAFDFAGAALLGTGLGSLLLGISEGARWGWSSPATICVLVAAVLVMTTWVLVELRTSHPLINLRTFARPDVVLANATAIGLGGALYIGLSLGSLVAQAPESTGYGLALPVFWAGFVMFPLSVGSFLANRVVRRVSRRIDLAVLLPTGAGLMTSAAVLLWLAHSELWELVCGMFLFGVGMGASYAAMPALIARSVAVAELGSSVSFNQVLRTVGSSFGTAISAAVIAAHTTAGGGTTNAGISATFAVSAMVCLTVFAVLTMHTLATHRSRSQSRRSTGTLG